MSADKGDTDLAKLKGYYLCGIIHSGFSEENLRHFLDVEKRAQITNWSLNQLIDAGQEFVRKNKTEREVKLTEALAAQASELSSAQEQIKQHPASLAKSQRSGFLDGVMSDPAFSFSDFCKFLLKCTTTPIDDLTVDALKLHLRAYHAAKIPKLGIERLEEISIIYSPPISPSKRPARPVIADPEVDADLVLGEHRYKIPGVQTPMTQLAVESDVEIELSE